MTGLHCALPLELRMNCVRRVGCLWPVLTVQSDGWVGRRCLAEPRPAVSMCHKWSPGLWTKPVKLTVRCRAIARPSTWSESWTWPPVSARQVGSWLQRAWLRRVASRLRRVAVS